MIELKQYLQLAQLLLDSDVLDMPVTDYIHEFRAIARKDISLSNEAILYSYEIPKLSPDGSCSIFNTPDTE